MYNSNARHHFVQYSSADQSVAFAVIRNTKHDAQREREGESKSEKMEFDLVVQVILWPQVNRNGRIQRALRQL